MKAYHIDEYAVPALDAVDKVDEIPINVAMGHTFEITNVVKRVKPDIFITHPGGQNTTARYGIPIYPAFGPGIYNGYAGLFSIARGVKRALENSEYNKLLAKHRKLPYTKEWYEKDPAYYITELDDPEK
jgi:nitrogenase molybdenum-iron protein alpha chain